MADVALDDDADTVMIFSPVLPILQFGAVAIPLASVTVVYIVEPFIVPPPELTEKLTVTPESGLLDALVIFTLGVIEGLHPINVDVSVEPLVLFNIKIAGSSGLNELEVADAKPGLENTIVAFERTADTRVERFV